MDLQNLMNKIDNKALEEKLKEQEEEAKRNDKIVDYKSRVLALGDRINNLIILANHCLKNGIDIGKKHRASYSTDSYLESNFYTDGWSHFLGFYIDYKNNTIETIGIECGGACGNIDLVINNKGEILTCNWNDLWSIKRFANEFAEFEYRFIKYLNNL